MNFFITDFRCQYGGSGCGSVERGYFIIYTDSRAEKMGARLQPLIHRVHETGDAPGLLESYTVPSFASYSMILYKNLNLL